MNSRDLDNYITGHGGEDQLRVYCEQCGKEVKGDIPNEITSSGVSHPFCSLTCMAYYAKTNL